MRPLLTGEVHGHGGVLQVTLLSNPMPLISSLAFPAPKLDYMFYSNTLLERNDLVYLTTSEGEHIPAVHVMIPDAEYTLIYSHGNGEDIGILLNHIDNAARQIGCNILMYDYVGYSLSRLEGYVPSELGCYRSITAAWRYLTIERKIDPEMIVLYGRSIGSGPTVDLASNALCNCAAVLLESPIASAARAVAGSAGGLARGADIFLNVEKIGNIKVPVGIMHGTKDEIVNWQNNGLALFNVLQEDPDCQPRPPLWCKDYGHNNMPHYQCFLYTRNLLMEIGGHYEEDDDVVCSPGTGSKYRRRTEGEGPGDCHAGGCAGGCACM